MSVLQRLLICLTLSACGSLRAEPETAAFLARATAESRAELERVISSALGGAPVTLADDALTSTSELTIERARPRDSQGRLINGRELGRPEHFRLLKVGTDCVLVHEASGQRFTLAHTTCVAAPN